MRDRESSLLIRTFVAAKADPQNPNADLNTILGITDEK